MKRLLLLSFVAFFVLIGKLAAQDTSFVQLWVNCHDSANAPSWFTDGSEPDLPNGDNSWAGTERGIVYNPIDGYLYVSSRHADDSDGDEQLDQGEPHVYVLNPLTGETSVDAVSLSTLGITSANPSAFGGGYPLNNVTVDESGQIFACNMTLASGPDIEGTDGAITVKAFRVYRWSWIFADPELVIDYKEGGYRLGDKFSIIGNWDEEAWIYAGPGESTKVLRWHVVSGVIDATPEIINLQDIAGAGTSITVAPSHSNDDWIYVSGKGFLPTLFHTDGTNLSQVAITAGDLPSSVLAGRTIEFAGSVYMAMFSSDQRAFLFDISKNGENVTDADIIGLTPVFGTKFANAYGEGAVEMGIIQDSLHIFICAPSNGIACYKVRGIGQGGGTAVKRIEADFEVTPFPNPATDFINVRFTLPNTADGAVAVKIFDMSGKFMGIHANEAHAGTQELRVPTSHLAPGTYNLQVVHGNKISSNNLIVIK